MKLLFILLFAGVILHAQDFQRFCGTYYLRGTCYESVFSYRLFSEPIVIIKEGIESDLLINISSVSSNYFKAFIVNDSFFIPSQLSLRGNGKIANDSLFLHYGYSIFDGVFDCDCKGGKTRNGYGGKIVYKLNPNVTDVEDVIFGIDLYNTGGFIFTINSQFISKNSKLMVDNIEYFNGDDVIVTGIIAQKEGLRWGPYIEIEIEKMEKMYFNTISFMKLSDNTKVHYNVIGQEIVIEESLQNQSLILELYDILGRMLLKQTDANTVSIANLPNGVYVYRLLDNNKIISSGKVVK